MPRQFSLAQGGLRPKYAMYDIPTRFGIDEAAVEVEMRTGIKAQYIKRYILERLSEYVLREKDPRKLFNRLKERDRRVAVWIAADVIEQISDSKLLSVVTRNTYILKEYAKGFLDKKDLREINSDGAKPGLEEQLCFAASSVAWSEASTAMDIGLAMYQVNLGGISDEEVIKRAARALWRMPYIE